MQKEIGSDFWFNTKTIEDVDQDIKITLDKYGVVGNDRIFLSTGRAAIRYALKDIKKSDKLDGQSVIIPPYTCDTVLQPFIDEGFRVYSYDINSELMVETEQFSRLLNSINPIVVLIHRYFGFDTTNDIQNIINEHRNRGSLFIEDKTQCLFSRFDQLDVDYYVGSFRKWDALPDGGFCIKNTGYFNIPNKQMIEDTLLIEQKMKAFQLKYDYIVEGIGKKETFLNAYEDAENTLDLETEFFSMSMLSKNIFMSLDVDKMSLKRKQNYTYVYDHLKNNRITILTGRLTDEVVPLYLVIKSKQRGEIQALLRENSIYAPIVWPKPIKMQSVSDTVNEIYDEVLCLPIDQRYDIDDMKRMVNILNNYNG